jgi:hypothetical protein
MGDDDHMMYKFDFLAPGEIVCDDCRTFKSELR